MSTGFVLGLVGARNRRRTETLLARLGATQEQLNLTLGALAEPVPSMTRPGGVGAPVHR